MRRSFKELSVESRSEIFWEIYRTLPLTKVDGEKLKNQIDQFATDSRAESCYVEIVTTARNYSQVPKRTDEWYDHLGIYLRKLMQLTEQGDFQWAVKCFRVLGSLYRDFMENGHEFVFDNEPCSWKVEPREKEWQESFAKARKGA